MPISWFFVSFHSFSFIYLGSSDPLVYGGDCRYLGLYLWGRWLWLRFSVTTCSSMFQYLPVASIYVWDIRPLTFSRSYYFLDTASVTDFSCISRGRHIMVPLTRFSLCFYMPERRFILIIQVHIRVGLWHFRDLSVLLQFSGMYTYAVGFNLVSNPLKIWSILNFVSPVAL